MRRYFSDRFPDSEWNIIVKMFKDGHSTKEASDYLIAKYSCPRSNTGNYIKAIRKRIGIYKEQNEVIEEKIPEILELIITQK